MELTFIIYFIIAIITFIYVYFENSFRYWRSRGIASDEPTIPYGNIKTLRKTINHGQFFKNVYDKHKPSGAQLCGIYFFVKPIAVLLDLDLIKSVLIKDFTNFVERGSFYYNEEDDPISAHLFSLNDDKWKKLRAKLTPTFTSGKMKFMFSTVIQVAERFRDCLFDVVQQHDQLEIKELLARFTTDVIGTCAFGIECNSLKDPNAEFRHYGRKAFGVMRHNALFRLFLNEFSSIGRTFHVKSVADDISEFFMKVVHDTVEYREKNQISRNDFMDLLIDLKNQPDQENSLTLNEVAAQAFIFFMAGFETSSTTLTFSLYELAQHLDVQSKARTVIQEAYKKYNGQLTYEMMMDMPYIDQILEETLRKYPPLPNLNRQAKNDYHVPGTDIVIEKGTSIFIPVYGIHHDPEYFPNPEQFDPDRFKSETKLKHKSMTWLAFGDGPRNCIGLRFGMMQARIGLIMLLKNFELTLGSKTPVPLVIEPEPFILSSKGGVYLKLKSVNSS